MNEIICNCGGMGKDHAVDCPAMPNSYQERIKESMRLKPIKED